MLKRNAASYELQISTEGGLGKLTDRDQRSIFLGIEFRNSVFFGLLLTAAVFLGVA